jgi:hypothetical protein
VRKQLMMLCLASDLPQWRQSMKACVQHFKQLSAPAISALKQQLDHSQPTALQAAHAFNAAWLGNEDELYRVLFTLCATLFWTPM